MPNNTLAIILIFLGYTWSSASPSTAKYSSEPKIRNLLCCVKLMILTFTVLIAEGGFSEQDASRNMGEGIEA